MNNDEVLQIGRLLNVLLTEVVAQPSFDSIPAIAGDTVHADFVKDNAPVSTVVVVDKKGEKHSFVLGGDPGTGKSAAGTDMRAHMAKKLGLRVHTNDPESLRKFTALAIRFAALSEV